MVVHGIMEYRPVLLRTEQNTHGTSTNFEMLSNRFWISIHNFYSTSLLLYPKYISLFQLLLWFFVCGITLKDFNVNQFGLIATKLKWLPFILLLTWTFISFCMSLWNVGKKFSLIWSLRYQFILLKFKRQTFRNKLLNI